jgi:hypothetical protein
LEAYLGDDLIRTITIQGMYTGGAYTTHQFAALHAYELVWEVLAVLYTCGAFFSFTAPANIQNHGFSE